MSQRPGFMPPSCSAFFNTQIHDDCTLQRAWWVTQETFRGQAEKEYQGVPSPGWDSSTQPQASRRGWQQCSHGREAADMRFRAASCQPQRSPGRAAVPPFGHKYLTFLFHHSMYEVLPPLWVISFLSTRGLHTLYLLLEGLFPYFCLTNTYLSLKSQLKGHLQIWYLKKRFGFISLF